MGDCEIIADHYSMRYLFELITGAWFVWCIPPFLIICIFFSDSRKSFEMIVKVAQIFKNLKDIIFFRVFKDLRVRRSANGCLIA
jgi:hypothetical protein